MQTRDNFVGGVAREVDLKTGVPLMNHAIYQRSWVGALLVVVVALGSLLVGDSFCWDRRGPQAPTEIFAGITYGRERLETTQEGRGFLHWVRIDLTAAGIELYVTPLDPTARAQGWQYRLRRIEDVVSREHLAVAINGTLFTSNSGWWPRMSGDLAASVRNRGGRPRRQSRLGAHVFAVVRRPINAAFAALEAANGGRARSGEMGHRWTRGRVVGWQSLARYQRQPRFAHGRGCGSAAQAFVFGCWPVYLTASSA